MNEDFVKEMKLQQEAHNEDMRRMDSFVSSNLNKLNGVVDDIVVAMLSSSEEAEENV